ncbi:MAG: hypothetical protein EXR99_07815 [Gemmataceae bacterium]|nr:hypothetical protein [Gemmataceae bacterium]
MKRMMAGLGLALLALAMTYPVQAAEEGKKKLVLIAGRKSHGYGQHSFKAGCMLLKKALDENVPGLETVVVLDGWPKDESVFNGAAGICIFSDGGGGHPYNANLSKIDSLAKKGVGLAMMHYAVEVPKGKSGEKFLEWIGGYFEPNWSVNPHWRLKECVLAKNHPLTNGVGSFESQDEWYYHMRFPEKMTGVTPILSAMPPKDTLVRADGKLSRGDGPHSNNQFVREAVLDRKEKQVLAWAMERPDGGRGFGYTGAHSHWNWGIDNNRKLILNSLVWICKMEVPAKGVESKRPTLAELRENMDYPAPDKFDFAQIEKYLAGANTPGGK